MAESIEKKTTLPIADIWAMVRDNIWWYVFSILFFLAVAVFYLYRTPNTYSRVEKVIVDEDSQSSMMRDLTSFAGYNRMRYGRGTNVDNEMEAFASPDLMEQVVRRLNLETTYTDLQFLRTRELYTGTPVMLSLLGGNMASNFSFVISKTGPQSFVLKDFRVKGDKLKADPVSGSLGDSLVTPVGALRISPTVHFEDWKNDISISWATAMSRAKGYCSRMNVYLSTKQSSVVVLAIQDLFPRRAESILRTLLDIYDEDWISNKNRSARNTSDFIKDRLVIIEEELGGIEEDLKDYKASHRIADISDAARQYLDLSKEYAGREFEVSNQLSIAKYIREYLGDPVHARSLIPANSGLVSDQVNTQIGEYNTLLLERDRLLKSSSENNPLIRDMNASLDAIRLSISRSVENLIATLQLQVDKVEQEQRQIMNKISSASGEELQLLSITRQQKVKEQLYIYLLQKREENELSSLVNVANTRLIMAPNGAPAPVSPNKIAVFLVALLLGFFLPLVYFFLRKMLDSSVKTRSDLVNLKLPFLAEIPQMGLNGSYWKRLRTNRFDDSNCAIIVQGGKRDMMNEAFRVLRTNLDLMVGQKEGCHVVMVTSFTPNAGKTFTIMNMAASMAIKGSRVLLLDLDLRKATLSKSLDRNNHGVSAYLNGKSEHILDSVQHVAEHLDIISVGTLPPNPAELLVSDRFKAMVEELKGSYDYIFFDCPPIDIVADTSIVAAHADLTVFIVRAGMFDKPGIAVLNDLYESGKYNRMSLILNGVESFSRGYGHYGYGYGHYGYGYGYGYGEQDKS